MIHWDIIDPEFLTVAKLLAEYRASDAAPGDPRQAALADEIKSRNLDI